LIAAEVKRDSRKLDSFEAFENSLSGDGEVESPDGRDGRISLKDFADQRRAYLLNHPEIKRLTGS
jgi:hypothetical protein